MPDSRLARLPLWVSRWLGYRQEPPPPLSKYAVAGWSFIAAFCGVSVVQAVFNHSSYFLDRHVPEIVASYGASAVLVYGSIEVPLAQPRTLIFGHFFSALTGVCMIKLFGLIPDRERFEAVRWLAASLSTAVATVVMQVTGTTHPPAGATALLPVINDQIHNLSWYFLPVVLLSSTLLLGVALLLNNLQRRYPVFWFTPPAPAKPGPVIPSSVSIPSETSAEDEGKSPTNIV